MTFSPNRPIERSAAHQRYKSRPSLVCLFALSSVCPKVQKAEPQRSFVAAAEVPTCRTMCASLPFAVIAANTPSELVLGSRCCLIRPAFVFWFTWPVRLSNGIFEVEFCAARGLRAGEQLFPALSSKGFCECPLSPPVPDANRKRSPIRSKHRSTIAGLFLLVRMLEEAKQFSFGYSPRAPKPSCDGLCGPENCLAFEAGPPKLLRTDCLAWNVSRGGKTELQGSIAFVPNWEVLESGLLAHGRLLKKTYSPTFPNRNTFPSQISDFQRFRALIPKKIARRYSTDSRSH